MRRCARIRGAFIVESGRCTRATNLAPDRGRRRPRRLPGRRHGVALPDSTAHSHARDSFDLDEFVAEHNRNAERSRACRPSRRSRLSRDAAGSITLREWPHGDGATPELQARAVRGSWSPARPTSARTTRNSGSGSPIPKGEVDLLVQLPRPRSSDPPVTYQPDWIIEAMGLKPISPQEAAADHGAEAGPKPDTTLLIFPPIRGRGWTLPARWSCRNSDRRIKKLQIFIRRSRASLIAEAEPSHYQAYPDQTRVGSSSNETAYLARKPRSRTGSGIRPCVLDVDAERGQRESVESSRWDGDLHRAGYAGLPQNEPGRA